MKAIVESAQTIGTRKLGVVYTVIGIVFLFLMVRSLLPLWVEGLSALEDIPIQCAMLLGGVPAAFFGVNLWGKFSPKVRAGSEPS